MFKNILLFFKQCKKGEFIGSYDFFSHYAKWKGRRDVLIYGSAAYKHKIRSRMNPLYYVMGHIKWTYVPWNEMYRRQ